MNPPVVLITGARAPAALDLARSFAAAGYAAHMADCSRCRMARTSRTPAAVHAYASPVAAPEAFERDVMGLVERLQPRLIVAACEEVFHLAAVAERRPEVKARLFAPPLDALLSLHSKVRFAAVAAGLGLAVPETWTLESEDDLHGLPPSDGLVFKPEFSRFGVRTLIRPKPEAAAALRPTPGERWVAQRRVTGTEASFHAACRDGRVTAFAAYGSAWRARGGAAYAFESVPEGAAAVLRAMAALLAEAAVGNGQFACDVLFDATGRPWLLECNPRATSGLHLFGRDPALARALTGEGGAVEAGPGPMRRLGPAWWLFGLPTALAEGRLGAWRRGLAQGRDVIGAPGDPGPIAGALADSLDFAVRGLASGRGLAAAMTADIEWNG